MLDLIAKAALCVSASRYEGFGLAVAETIAGGCVPVLQRHQAFADLVGPLGQNHLVDFCDAHSAARTIHYIANNPAELSQASDTGRQHIRQFDWDHIFPKWQKLYSDVLGHA
jgi:glycosyltransferase involved in cell wall biosynthesis